MRPCMVLSECLQPERLVYAPDPETTEKSTFVLPAHSLYSPVLTKVPSHRERKEQMSSHHRRSCPGSGRKAIASRSLSCSLRSRSMPWKMASPYRTAGFLPVRKIGRRSSERVITEGSADIDMASPVPPGSMPGAGMRRSLSWWGNYGAGSFIKALMRRPAPNMMPSFHGLNGKGFGSRDRNGTYTIITRGRSHE